MDIKDMKRTDWHRCLHKEYIARDFQRNGHQGQARIENQAYIAAWCDEAYRELKRSVEEKQR